MKGAISIGAHYGEEYELWLSQGAKNFIFIEPCKDAFAKLSRIMKDKPNVTLLNHAIGSYDGSVEMHIETEHQGKSNSILEPYLHLEQYPDIRFKGKEKVSIRRLDGLYYDHKLYDHLHIDTQGYEMEVLKGAEMSLLDIKTIQIEVYRKELYKGCAIYQDILIYLTDLGFSQESVIWRGLTWGDAYFKRYES